MSIPQHLYVSIAPEPILLSYCEVSFPDGQEYFDDGSVKNQLKQCIFNVMIKWYE